MDVEKNTVSDLRNKEEKKYTKWNRDIFLKKDLMKMINIENRQWRYNLRTFGIPRAGEPLDEGKRREWKR